MKLMRKDQLKNARSNTVPTTEAAPTRPAKRPRVSSLPTDKKRRKPVAEEAFSVVEESLSQLAPPLMPTPQSLFCMLCDVFELHFPGRLPQHIVDEALLALSKT